MLERFCTKDIKNGLITWVRDEFSKSGKAGIAVVIDGTLDSLFATAICCEAVGTERVIGVALLNTKNGSEVDKYGAISEELGIKFKRFNISSCTQGMLLQYAFNIDENVKIPDSVINNIEARLSMDMLRVWTDSNDYLVCGHNDYSKITVGKFTRGGDNTSDFNPNAYLTSIEIQHIINEEMPNIQEIKDKYIVEENIHPEISDIDIHKYIRGIRMDDNDWCVLRNLEGNSIKNRLNIPAYKATDEELGRFNVNNIQN